MITEEKYFQIASYQACAKHFVPDSEVIACALLIHGQGDFGARYQDVATVFCDQGISVMIIDLPGHGVTNGARGDIPSMMIAEEFIATAYEFLGDKYPEAPIGLLAHSMGCQLALRELLINSREYSFCWMNGPLLYPAKRKRPIELSVLKLLARIIPRYTISTQVKRTQCRKDSLSKNDPLFHSRISLRWGLSLVKSAAEVESLAVSQNLDIPILVTQGELDMVNPTKYAEEFFKRVSWPRLQYVEIPEALHEPFYSNEADEFYDVLRTWCMEQNRISSINNYET